MQFDMVNTDLSFITNEGDVNLLERFKTLIRGTRFFDALVGYFYTSGFHLLCDSLETTERIRILIGIGTGKGTTDLITEARRHAQRELGFSHREAADAFAEAVTAELEPPAQDDLVEHGVRKFVEWLRSGKLQIRAYPDANIHAKLYIMTFAEDDRDAGRVITGSSNFSQSGLKDNIEFNVELKNRADYEFALTKFVELWDQSADVGPNSTSSSCTSTSAMNSTSLRTCSTRTCLLIT
ncbi:MAG: phospholipase D-like domain-containing protein [candidate division WOR-3 bacterium]|nr:phospholipase D-like domain-containing protein [candidate division WOR-3 bacterium]